MKTLATILKNTAWAIEYPKFALCWLWHRKPYSAVYGPLMAVVMLFACAQAKAQDASTNLPTANGFFQAAASWISSVDTNNTLFDDATMTLWAGNSYVNNANNASTLGLDYRVWRSTNSGLQLTIESETRNAGVAGTIYSQQMGLQLSKGFHDLRLGGFIDGGYSFVYNKPYVEAGVDIRKATGKVTFIYGRVGYQFIEKKAAGVFEAGIGVKL